MPLIVSKIGIILHGYFNKMRLRMITRKENRINNFNIIGDTFLVTTITPCGF